MRYVPGNAQHIGARREQQDSFAFSDPGNKQFLAHGGLLALISDGMGGLSNGQQASMAAVRAFLAAYERKRAQDSIPAAMRRGLQAAFDVVNGLNQGGGQSGATLVAAVAHGADLYWVSVGDSRLYLIRGGRLVQLTRDHSYGERLLDQVADDQIGLADAIAHPEREHLTSYLGMAGTPEIDANVRPFPLEPNDQIVLCTDGVYRAASEQDFTTAFAQNPSQGCEALMSAVLSHASEHQDNLTVVTFRCVGDAPKAVATFGGLRAKLAVAGACALFCANLFAAKLAWSSLQQQMRTPVAKPVSTPTKQKDLGPGPAPADTPPETTPPVAEQPKDLQKAGKASETPRPKHEESGSTPPAGEGKTVEPPATPAQPHGEPKSEGVEGTPPAEALKDPVQPPRDRKPRREEKRGRGRGTKNPEILRMKYERPEPPSVARGRRA